MPSQGVRAVAVPQPVGGSWTLAVLDGQGERVRSMGFAAYGDTGRPIEAMLRSAVIGLKYRPLSDWTRDPDGTMTMTVERF